MQEKAALEAQKATGPKKRGPKPGWKKARALAALGDATNTA